MMVCNVTARPKNELVINGKAECCYFVTVGCRHGYLHKYFGMDEY